MHKKDVFIVDPRLLNATVERSYKNRGSIAWSVGEPLSGKRDITLSIVANIGSGSGLARITLSDSFANSPAIVRSNLTVLKITGLNKIPRSNLNMLRFAI